MRILLTIISTFIIAGAANLVSAQCGPTEVEPTPQVLGFCEGTPDTITFAADGQCSGNYEYQVLTSTNNTVQAWSNNNQFIITNPVSDTYTVETRCSTCPSVVESDTFTVAAITEPVIAGDTFICHNTSTSLNASSPPAETITWWDDSTGGNQLSSDENFTTPAMTSDETFFVRASGIIQGGDGGQGSILITECGLEGFPGSASADYIEITNLYNTPVNTSGWVVAISDSYSNINIKNPIEWQLPSSFTPCSMISRTDVSYQPNYWGNNIFWAANQPGWAAIVDDNGNLVDFLAWGWTAAQIANFNTTINGYNITIGNEWNGNGVDSNCQKVGGVPYSFSRTGNADNNDAGDFICQASSLNGVNPGLNCGWIASDFECPYPVTVEVDLPPTASAPDTTFLECYADVPTPNTSIITDATDDHTTPPTVEYVGESSSGNTCPEILTRTYKVSDSCSNSIEVEHIIVINDTVAPVMDAAPADLFVACYDDVPPMATLNWTDNCLGSGQANGVETSDGNTCPEVLTRTWTVSDTCGNTTTETQTITIHDSIAPDVDSAPADLTIQCPSDLPPMASLNWSDNCAGSGVLNGTEVSDGQTCPETITRTWTVSDGCDNTTTETQVIVINDDIPPVASNLPSLQLTELPSPDISVINATDNCGEPTVEWVSDSSDNGFCPENIIRTYSATDDCGNVTYITRHFIIGDHIPNVSFFADPTLLDNFSDGVVQFSNQTTGAVSYEWDFGDTSAISNELSPTHEYDISSSRYYKAWLVATSEYDCKDSASVIIQVFKELVYFVPNAFTPDNDGINDSFKPIFVAGFNPNDYHLEIFNRWGETLFESHNHEVGWDGTYGGKRVQEGTYLYKISFGLKRNEERKVITGHFSLLK